MELGHLDPGCLPGALTADIGDQTQVLFCLGVERPKLNYTFKFQLSRDSNCGSHCIIKRMEKKKPFYDQVGCHYKHLQVVSKIDTLVTSQLGVSTMDT